MAKSYIGTSILWVALAFSCTSGPDFVPDRYGNDKILDTEPVSESDSSPTCTHTCVFSHANCDHQGGITHDEMSCPGGEVCCEVDKGAADSDPPGEDKECTYDCMASWLCSFRGKPHPDMTCNGRDICCEVGGTGPGQDEPGPNPGSECQFDCVNAFMCRFIGAERPEMSCPGNNVCCEREGDSPEQPGEEDPAPGACEFECVSFFECRSDGAIRHDEMSCDRWSEVCCEYP